MIGLIVWSFSGRNAKSKFIFDVTLSISKIFYRLRGVQLQFDGSRFKSAAWVKSPRKTRAGHFSKQIDLVIVSTSKDFDILVHSVKHAVKALSDYHVNFVKIIVPNRDVEQCERLFSNSQNHILVVNEEDLVPEDQFAKLTHYFGGRNTWVLQQLLKVQAVLSSESDAILILDSDTILLRRRPWFDRQGKQLLMPTYEYNRFYYEFLNKIKVSEVVPKYSLISHHMIMQPLLFREIMSFLDIHELSELIEIVCKNAELTIQSPICLEYELYGQYLINYKPNSYFFGKWANLTIPKRYSILILRSPVLQFFLRANYHSISFHSWS
jgi:hypothetical protein